MKTLATLAMLAALTGAAFAQDVVDADGDGLFSLAEIAAIYPNVTEADLMVIDANGDGVVDADELAAAEVVGILAN